MMRVISNTGLAWEFLRVRKKWWLAPILLTLLLLGLILYTAQSSVVAPFIYTIF
jgi:hypothetical protein